jgi:predicted nucleic acid-binding protein
MKVVISDASCLILLTNLDRLELLEKLYGEIMITDSVATEYRLPLPDFISIRNPIDRSQVERLLEKLDAGEASSVALALENPGCRIIIDEKKGRQIAITLGLDLTGTLGILIEAAKVSFIRIDKELVEKLEDLGFHLSREIKEEFLRGV